MCWKKISSFVTLCHFFFMVLLDHYVICRFLFVPWRSEAVDFKNIFCGCYAITDRWKLVCFHVVRLIIIMWQMQKIVRWNLQYCNIMVEWASFFSLCTGGSGCYLGQYSSYPVCATSYLSRQMHRTQSDIMTLLSGSHVHWHYRLYKWHKIIALADLRSCMSHFVLCHSCTHVWCMSDNSYWHGSSMNLWGYDIFNSLKNFITEEKQNENV
jgi:hypothetical protein